MCLSAVTNMKKTFSGFHSSELCRAKVKSFSCLFLYRIEIQLAYHTSSHALNLSGKHACPDLNERVGGYGLQIWALINNESANSKDKESYILLSLMPRFVILAVITGCFDHSTAVKDTATSLDTMSFPSTKSSWAITRFHYSD